MSLGIVSVTIVLAAMSNTLVKGAIAWFAGSPAIRRTIAQSTILIVVVTFFAMGILQRI